MTTNDNNAIPVPSSLTERQVRLAKQFVIDRHEKGYTIKEFCNKNSVSTRLWYDWQKTPDFERYLTDLQGNVVSDDERSAYHIVKKKIMANATKKDASPKEIDQFLETFEYVVLAEKREAMRKLGISDTDNKGSDFKTIEEKKNVLIQRLKG